MTKNKMPIILSIYLVMSLIILTSCTENQELNTLAMVTSVGVDIEDEKVILTCEIINPKSSNSKSNISAHSSEDVIFAQGKGNTVFEAVRDITLHFDRKLFFTHSNILIFGEEFAKRGITEFMDLFLRDYEPRENSYMVIAKGSKAYEIMGVKGELSSSGGNYLYDILDNYRHNGRSKNISIADYYRYYYEVSSEPVLGIAEKKKVAVIDVERQMENPTKYILDVSGGAVLKRDYLIGYFSEDEMLGYNFIVDEISEGVIVFEISNGLNKNEAIIGKEGKFGTMEILDSETKKDIRIIDGKIHLYMDVNILVSLQEVNKAINVDDMKVIGELEEDCSQKVKKLISKTMDKGQKRFKQDNFSIGMLVYRKYPEIWKEISEEWSSIFPEITYSVDIKTKIAKIGIINIPSNLRKRR